VSSVIDGNKWIILHHPTPSPILLDDRWSMILPSLHNGSANRRQNRPKFRRQNHVVEVSDVGLLKPSQPGGHSIWWDSQRIRIIEWPKSDNFLNKNYWVSWRVQCQVSAIFSLGNVSPKTISMALYWKNRVGLIKAHPSNAVRWSHLHSSYRIHYFLVD
jgi:hypothetical protein